MDIAHLETFFFHDFKNVMWINLSTVVSVTYHCVYHNDTYINIYIYIYIKKQAFQDYEVGGHEANAVIMSKQKHFCWYFIAIFIATVQRRHITDKL